MSTSVPLSFTLKLQTLPVELDGKLFTITELTGKQRDQYLDANRARLKLDKGKVVGLTSFQGIHAELLTLCMADLNRALVTKDQIDGWPASVTEQLFDAARSLSKLGKDEKAKDTDEEAKND